MTYERIDQDLEIWEEMNKIEPQSEESVDSEAFDYAQSLTDDCMEEAITSLGERIESFVSSGWTVKEARIEAVRELIAWSIMKWTRFKEQQEFESNPQGPSDPPGSYIGWEDL